MQQQPQETPPQPHQPPGSFPAQIPIQMPQPTAQQPFHPPNSLYNDPGTQQQQQQHPVYDRAPSNLPSQQQTSQTPQQPQFANLQRPQPTYTNPQDVIAPAPLQPDVQAQRGGAVGLDGDGAPAVSGDVVDGEGMRGGRRKRRRQSKFQDRNVWTGGQSIVGRKGKDGEWIEVRCSLM